ncbi:MAG: NAD(P)H-binding protein [Bacteroidota bacterium]
MKTAILIGATGLTGSHLLILLLQDARFDKVKVFTRRSLHIQHDKLEEYIIDFDKPDSWKRLVTGDVLYSALGTTIKKAGTQVAQYKIDYTYQYQMALAASNNRVPMLVMVSSVGAAPHSKFFYTRMKGELERDVKLLPFESIYIMRPMLVWGGRKEFRLAEAISVAIFRFLAFIPGLRKLKPTTGAQIAKAMVLATFLNEKGSYNYAMGDIIALSRE